MSPTSSSAWWLPAPLRMVTAFVYGLSVLILAMALGLLIGALMLLPFAPLPRGRRERYTIVGTQLWARSVLLMLGVRIEQHGRPLDRHAGGALIVCNHRSWLDPILLIARTASNGLSKREIGWIPFIGQFGWLGGAIFFDRRHKRARTRARDDVLRLLRGGFRVQLYPEGTRSRDGRLREKVYLALIHDCYDAGLPVVPCAVAHTERVLPPGVYGAFPGQQVRLWVGAPLQPADYPNAEAFAQRCWQQVVQRCSQG